MKNLRWTSTDNQNFSNEERAQRDVRAWAATKGVLLGHGLQICATRSLVRAALGGLNGVADEIRRYNANTPDGHVQDQGKWRRLSESEVTELASLKVCVPHRSRRHLQRWDARRAFESAK